MSIGQEDYPLFWAVCVKVIPKDVDPKIGDMIGALVERAVEQVRGTPDGTEAAVLESVKGAFDALERGLYPARAEARAIFRRMKEAGTLPQPWLQDPSAVSALTPMRGVEAPPPKARLLPVGTVALLKGDGCTSAIEDATGRMHRCCLSRDHEGAHHHTTTGWFWSIASGNAVLMSKPGEEKK